MIRSASPPASRVRGPSVPPSLAAVVIGDRARVRAGHGVGGPTGPHRPDRAGGAGRRPGRARVGRVRQPHQTRAYRRTSLRRPSSSSTCSTTWATAASSTSATATLVGRLGRGARHPRGGHRGHHAVRGLPYSSTRTSSAAEGRFLQPAQLQPAPFGWPTPRPSTSCRCAHRGVRPEPGRPCARWRLALSPRLPRPKVARVSVFANPDAAPRARAGAGAGRRSAHPRPPPARRYLHYSSSRDPHHRSHAVGRGGPCRHAPAPPAPRCPPPRPGSRPTAAPEVTVEVDAPAPSVLVLARQLPLQLERHRQRPTRPTWGPWTP